MPNNPYRDDHTFQTPDLDVFRNTRGQATYWCGNQGQIYIGSYLVDEVIGFGYEIRQNKVPVYGYSSQYFDAVADGKVLVTGWITINYVDSNYLFAAMSEYVKDRYALDAHDVQDVPLPGFRREQIFGPTGQAAELFKRLDETTKQNPFAQPDIRLMKQIAEALGQQSLSRNMLITALRNRYWGKERTKLGLEGNRQNKDLKLTDIMKTQDGNTQGFFNTYRADQMPKVSITVAHGDPLDKMTSTYRVILDVHFLGCQQNVVSSDDPQTETYSFIARSIAN